MSKLKVKFSKNTRTELMMGREYLVVPTIPIKEGVHNWTLLLADELERSAQMWNGMPVTYNHPEDKYGWPTVINDKETADKYVTGIVLNSHFKEDGLEWESWFEKERLMEFNPDTLSKLEKGEMEEGSVGYWAGRTDFVEGEWNGEYYWAIDYDIIPNHYAVLGDEGTLGACSIEDGCGCGRTYQQLKEEGEQLKKLFRVQSTNKLFQDGGFVEGTEFKIDNSKESACQRQWSNANIDRYLQLINASKNTEELKEDFYLSDENHAHHIIVNEKMIINVDAIKGYKALHDSGKVILNDLQLNHLKTHFDELELDWGDTKFSYENNDDEIIEQQNLNTNKEEVIMNEELKQLIEQYGEEKALEILSKFNDVGEDKVEKLIGFEKEVGVEKIGELISNFNQEKEQKAQELTDLRAEMVKEFEMTEEEVGEMGYNALKAVKDRLIKAKEQEPSNYSLFAGGGDNNGKEVKTFSVDRDRNKQ